MHSDDPEAFLPGIWRAVVCVLAVAVLVAGTLTAYADEGDPPDPGFGGFAGESTDFATPGQADDGIMLLDLTNSESINLSNIVTYLSHIYSMISGTESSLLKYMRTTLDDHLYVLRNFTSNFSFYFGLDGVISTYLISIRDTLGSKLDTVNTNLGMLGSKLDTANLYLGTVLHGDLALIDDKLVLANNRLETLGTYLTIISGQVTRLIQGMDDANEELDTITDVLRGSYDSYSQAISDVPYTSGASVFSMGYFTQADGSYVFGTRNDRTWTVAQSIPSIRFVTWSFTWQDPVQTLPYLAPGAYYRFSVSWAGTCSAVSDPPHMVPGTLKISNFRNRVTVSFVATASEVVNYPWFTLACTGSVLPGEFSFSAVRDDSLLLSQSVQDAGQGIQEKIEGSFDTSESSGLGSAAVDFAGQAGESLGVVSYVDTLFSGLSGLIVSGSTLLTFPSISIDIEGASYQLWGTYTFDLSELDGWLAGLMAVVRLATSIVVVGAVLSYLQRVYKEIIG